MSTADRPLDPGLLAAHTEGLRALARHLVRDAHRAEDVVQDAMLAAVRRPPPDGVPLGPWLVGVVRNLARMSRRGEARRAAREQAPGHRGPDEPADAAVARAETHRRLVDAVLSLAEPYRSTIVMRYLDGLSPSEIARRTGEPAATVRTRVHRGLALLRERLDADARRDGRSWVGAFVLLTRRTPLRLHRLSAVAACVVVAAGAAVTWHLASPAATEAGVERTVSAADAPSRDDANEHVSSGARRVPRRQSDAVPEERVATPDDESDAPAPTPEPATPESGPFSVSIEVVDEDGNRLREGTVKLDLANASKLADADVERYARHAERFGETGLAAANPVVVGDLPPELDGLEIAVSARVPGRPPSDRVTCVLHAGRAETVKLVASRPRSAAVRVIDRLTDSPIAGASVWSSTELLRRVMDTASASFELGDGRVLTGDDGTCSLGGLGGGEHAIVVEAAGFARERVTWDGSPREVRVKMTRAKGTATVAVTVTGPDERPVAGIGVELFGTDRVMKTDTAGRAVFDDVEAGFVAVSVETETWFEVCRAAGRKDLGEHSKNTVAEAGGTSEIALGFLRNAAYLDARVAAEDGSPREGVVVHLLGMTTMMSADATTDANGHVRFEHLSGGRYMARIGTDDADTWWVGRIDVPASTRVERTWILGERTIRGRVVSGPEHAPVAGVKVYAFREGLDGASVATGNDGRFEIRNARTGTHRFSVTHDGGGARRAGVAIPCDEEIVLEIVPHGRLAVRFRPEDRADLLASKLRLLTADGEFAGEMQDGEGDDDLVATGLVPGRYEIEVTRGERARRFSVEVQSGETSVVVVAAP